MRRAPLKSSTIASAGYDPTLSVLELEFASGDVYQYFAVPEKIFLALASSDRPGRYFNAHIRDRFPSTGA